MKIDEDVYLKHYGKKGMRWGVRRAVRRESKITKFENKARSTQDKIDKTDAKIAKYKRNTYSKGQLEIARENLEKSREKALKNAEAVRQHKLTSGQKKAVAGGMVIGAAATAVMLKKYQNVKLDKLRLSNKEFLETKKLLDSKMQKRLKALQDLSNMTSGDHPSRKGALKEIDNLNEFYSLQVSKMTNRFNVDPKVIKKLKVPMSL